MIDRTPTQTPVRKSVEKGNRQGNSHHVVKSPSDTTIYAPAFMQTGVAHNNVATNVTQLDGVMTVFSPNVGRIRESPICPTNPQLSCTHGDINVVTFNF